MLGLIRGTKIHPEGTMNIRSRRHSVSVKISQFDHKRHISRDKLEELRALKTTSEIPNICFQGLNSGEFLHKCFLFTDI